MVLASTTGCLASMLVLFRVAIGSRKSPRACRWPALAIVSACKHTRACCVPLNTPRNYVAHGLTPLVRPKPVLRTRLLGVHPLHTRCSVPLASRHSSSPFSPACLCPNDQFSRGISSAASIRTLKHLSAASRSTSADTTNLSPLPERVAVDSNSKLWRVSEVGAESVLRPALAYCIL